MKKIVYSDLAEAGISRLQLADHEEQNLRVKINFQIARNPTLTAVRTPAFSDREMYVDLPFVKANLVVRILLEVADEKVIIWSVSKRLNNQ